MSIKSWLKPVSLSAAVVAGALASVGLMERPAQADYSIAFCNGQNYAVNVHYPGDPGGSAELRIRIFYRPDGVVFLNTAALREPNPEGYNYSNIRGEHKWELFIPNGSSTCTLSRDGQAVDTGTVTRREPDTSGD